MVDGQNPFNFPLPSSGVYFSNIYELLRVAHFRGYKRLSEFLKEDWKEQALAIAHYRSHNQLEAVMAKREADKQKNLQKKGRKRAGPLVTNHGN